MGKILILYVLLTMESPIRQKISHKNSTQDYGQFSEKNFITNGEKKQKLSNEDKNKLKDLLTYGYLKTHSSLSMYVLKTSKIFSTNNKTIYKDLFASNKIINFSLYRIYQDRLNSIFLFLDNFKLSESKEIDLKFAKINIESVLKTIKTYSILSEQFENLTQKEKSNERFQLKIQELQKNIEIIFILQLEVEQIINAKKRIYKSLETQSKNETQKAIEKQNLKTEKEILLKKLIVFQENINNLLDQLTFQEPKEKLSYIGNAEKNTIIEKSEEMQQTLILFEELNENLQTLYQNINFFQQNNMKNKSSEHILKSCIELFKSFLVSELLMNITRLINALLNNSFFKDSIDASKIIGFYFTEDKEDQIQIKKIFQFGITGLKNLQNFKNQIESLDIFLNYVLNFKLQQYSIKYFIIKFCAIKKETLDLSIKIQQLKKT
jgi:hypothetical protein